MSEQMPAAKAGAMPLNRTERRVLGVLVEKAFTSQDSYPLTANALVAGCNQKNNREPLTNLEPHQIDEALFALQAKGLVTKYFPASGRTERWKHNMKETWLLEREARAVLCELLLRGPQTEGDLRGRASRMCEIASLDDLRRVLAELAQRDFVKRLTPEGRKRGGVWTHLICSPEELARWQQQVSSDTSDDDELESPARVESRPEARSSPVMAAATVSTAKPVAVASPTAADAALAERITRMETRIEQLTAVVADVRQQLEEATSANRSLASELSSLRQQLGG